ncbi:MAG: hypothetical protein WCK05_06995, partial [Planctomycetota bacterium]
PFKPSAAHVAPRLSWTTVISNIVIRATGGAVEMDGLLWGTKIEMAGLVVGIVSTALTIAVVSSVTRRQQQHRQAQQSQAC